MTKRNVVAENNEEYIDYKEFVSLLNATYGTTPKNTIVNEFKIRNMLISGKGYFNLKDTRKALDDAREYYSRYYTKRYIIEELKCSWSALIFKQAIITVPKKYRYVLEKQQYVYDKQKVKDILLKRGDGRQFEIKGKKYYTIETVIERLGIQNRNRGLISIRKEWQIEFTRSDKKVGYLATQIEMVKEQVELFYMQHYTSDEALQKIKEAQIEGIDDKVQRYTISSKYYWYLMQEYNPNRCRICYKKDDIDMLINKYKNGVKQQDRVVGINYNGKKYYTTQSVIETLEIIGSRSMALSKLCSEWGIHCIMVDSQKLYDAEQVDMVVEEIKRFYSNHYTRSQLLEILTSATISKYLKPIRLPDKYRLYMQGSCNYLKVKVVYPKKDVDILIEKSKVHTYTREEVMQLLNLNKAILSRLSQEYDLKPITHIGIRTKESSRQDKYDKEAIDTLIRKKEEFYSEHISISKTHEYFNGKKVPYELISEENVDRIPIPLYARDKNNLGQLAIKRIDLKRISDEYKKRKEIANLCNVLEKSPIETFHTRLKMYVKEDIFDENSEYTAKAWTKFVEGWLQRTTVKGKRMQVLINKLVYCTPIVKIFLTRTNKHEIYMLTSKQINLVMKSINKCAYCYVMELFFKEIALDPTIANKKKFKVEDIIIAEQLFKNKDTKKDEIYSFNEYIEIFNYCTNIEMQVNKSIKEIEHKGTSVYLSTWLFIILHLNNAWRYGDIKEFPSLHVEDLLIQYNIKDINWFRNNVVSLEMARSIIFRVHQWEFTISKTQLKGTFFCSDELAPAFATSVLMLEVVNMNRVIKSEYLMEFGRQENRIDKSIIKNFFRGTHLQELDFSSMKFNKTVMTYLYYIANLSGDSKGLLYAMKMRGHMTQDTTLNYYIKLNQEAVQELSKQLFARGEFGYIPTLLVKKINGGELKFEDITAEVEKLNRNFGDVVKINTTIAFMNSLRNERRELIKEINDMSLEEAQRLLTDIYTRKIPSRDSTDILCMCGRNGCIRTDKISCFDCQYHIPTIYAIQMLCENIKKDINIIKKTNLIPKLLCISMRIEKKKKILLDAMKTFGKEYIYECLNYNREEFINILSEIPSPDDILALVEDI